MGTQRNKQRGRRKQGRAKAAPAKARKPPPKARKSPPAKPARAKAKPAPKAPPRRVSKVPRRAPPPPPKAVKSIAPARAAPRRKAKATRAKAKPPSKTMAWVRAQLGRAKEKPREKISDTTLNAAVKVIFDKTQLAGLQKPKKLSRRKKLSILRKYKSVADGTAHVVEVPKATAKQYKRADVPGVTVLPGNRVIVPTAPGWDSPTVKTGDPILYGMISHKMKLKKGEAEVVTLPFEVTGVREWIKEVGRHKNADRLKYKGDKWMFGFGDGSSIDETNFAGFRAGSLEDLLEYLETYESTRKGITRAQDISQGRALTLFRVSGGGAPEIADRLAEQKAAKLERRAQAKRAAKFAKLRKERGG
jgi:hypothetical protein